MTSMKFISFIILIEYCVAFCTVQKPSIIVYPTLNEFYQWDLSKFFKGELLTYQLSESTQFSLIPPIAQLSRSVPHITPANEIISAKARRQGQQKVWRNEFAFVSTDRQNIDLYYSEASQADSNVAPSFKKKIRVVSSLFITCFDIEYIDADTFLIDCVDQKSKPIQNIFYKVSKQGVIEQIKTSNSNYSFTTRRIIQKQTIINKLGEEINYIYRATPAYATNFSGLDVSSKIEVYPFIDGKLSSIPKILDRVQLGILVQDPKPQEFQFSLIDYKVLSNGNLYILDALKGVYVLNIQDNGEFKFVDKFEINNKAFGFDAGFALESDGTSRFILTVLFSGYIRIFKDGEEFKEYNLPFAASYPSILYFTQNYIVIQNQGYTYTYSISENILISKDIINSQQILVNPYVSELVTISNTESKRLTISNGFMATNDLQITTKLSNITITAVDQQKNKCESIIYFRTLNSNDQNINEIQQLFLPSTIRDYPDPLTTGPLASGPNLQYQQISASDSISTTLVSVQDLKIQGIVLPDPSSLVFVDIIPISVDKFFLMTQTPDRISNYSLCSRQSELKSLWLCQLGGTYLAPSIQTRTTFQYWFNPNNGDEYYIALENDYRVKFMVDENREPEKVHYIDFPNTPENKVSSVNVFKFLFVIVLQAKKQIQFYQTHTSELLYLLDETVIRSLGYTGVWRPTRIYYNRAHKEYLFFIINQENVIVADLHTEFSILKVVPILTGAEVEIAIGKDSFFLIQRTNTQSLIQEYDLVNLSIIRLIKNLPLYSYTLQTPLAVDFSSDTGDVFIRAYDTKNYQTVVLIYSSLALSHDSLVKVIPLGYKVDDGKKMLIAGSGSELITIYICTDQLQRIVQMMKNPLLFIKPTYNSQKYYTKQDLTYKISNYFGITPLNQTQTIQLINTQVKLFIDQEQLSKEQFIAKTSSKSHIPLKIDWIDGSITTIGVDCDQCGEYIKVIQTVSQLSSSTFNNQKINDVKPYLNDKLVFLTNNQLIITALDLQILQQITISSNSSDRCSQLSINEDGQYMYAGCYINGIASIAATICITERQFECRKYGDHQKLTGITKFGKITAIGKSLIVLSTDINNVAAQQGALHIYNILDQNEQFKLQANGIIGTNFFNNGFTSYLSDFTIVEYLQNKVTYFQIYVMDINQGIYILNGQLTQGFFNFQQKYEQIYLKALLETGGYYTTNSQYLQIALIQQSIIGTVLTQQILFTTNNQAHYGLQVNFDLTTPPNPKIKSQKVIFLLNQYGDYTALNKLTVSNGFAAIIYTNQQKTLLATYQLPIYKENEVPLIRFTGGIETSYPSPQVDEFIALIQGSAPRLYTNIKQDSMQQLVVIYNLSNQFQIEVLNESNQVKEQELHFTIKNGQYAETANSYLRISDKLIRITK